MRAFVRDSDSRQNLRCSKRKKNIFVKTNADFYATLSIARGYICIIIRMLLACILNINCFKAILWRVARNRAASAKTILRLFYFPILHDPFFSATQSSSDWNSIRSRSRFTSRHRRLIPGVTPTSSILSMSRIRKNKPYGHRGVSVVAKTTKKRKKNTQVSVSRAASSDIWSRENCNGLAISDQHETVKKRRFQDKPLAFCYNNFSCTALKQADETIVDADDFTIDNV